MNKPSIKQTYPDEYSCDDGQPDDEQV